MAKKEFLQTLVTTIVVGGAIAGVLDLVDNPAHATNLLPKIEPPSYSDFVLKYLHFRLPSLTVINGLQTISRDKSACPTPDIHQSFDIPRFTDPSGKFDSIDVTPPNAKVSTPIGAFDFRPPTELTVNGPFGPDYGTIQGTAIRVVNELRTNDEYKNDANLHGPMAVFTLLFRADSDWAKKLEMARQFNFCAISELTEPQVEALIYLTSPNASAELQRIKESFQVQIPEQTGTKKLVVKIPPDQWDQPREAEGYARTVPMDWIPFFGSRNFRYENDGKMSTEVRVARYYPNYDSGRPVWTDHLLVEGVPLEAKVKGKMVVVADWVPK